MQIKIQEINGINIAEVVSNDIEIKMTQDALDLMANCGYKGAKKIIIHEKNIIPEFFDLKTGIAGEMLQKFATYRIDLAIVGDFSKYSSNALQAFIYESNKYGQINFVASLEEAEEKLSKNVNQ